MGIIRRFFQLKETAVTITADEKFIEVAKKGIIEAREIVERFITEDPFFLYTLEPYECPDNAPSLIKRMCEASYMVNVGPMASVAGAIAQHATEKMREKGADYVVVDNGGDIAFYSPRKELRVGIYTGNPLTNVFALLIPPGYPAGGICTSSGKVGPSISFGNADAVTILAKDAIIADAAATALGNMIKREENLKNAFRILEDVSGISGALAIIGRKIALWGELPEIIKTKIPRNKITWRWF